MATCFRAATTAPSWQQQREPSCRGEVHAISFTLRGPYCAKATLQGRRHSQNKDGDPSSAEDALGTYAPLRNVDLVSSREGPWTRWARHPYLGAKKQRALRPPCHEEK